LQPPDVYTDVISRFSLEQRANMKLLSMIVLLLALVPSAAFCEDLAKCRAGWNANHAGDYLSAIALFNSCAKEGDLSDASRAQNYRDLGIAYRRAKQSIKAIEAHTKAIAMNPENVVYDYINRGNAYDEAGMFKEAMSDYDKALELKPGYGEVFYNRGIAYEHQNMLDKAKAEFMSAHENGLRTPLLYERFQIYGLATPSSNTRDESGDLIEKRNAASGFAGTLQFAVGRAAANCRDILGRDDQYMRSIVNDWLKRNAKFSEAAEKWTLMNLAAIAEARGEEAAQQAQDQIIGIVEQDALKIVEVMLGTDTDIKISRCEKLATIFSSGAYDITEMAPLLKDLQELAGFFERTTPN